MAKPLDEPLTAADLENFVATQDDFGLELYVYSEARYRSYDATHGGSYTDRVTGKTRQYDIRVTIQLTSQLRLCLAIECKCLRTSSPLLVSRIPRVASESFNEKMQAAGKYTKASGDLVTFASTRPARRTLLDSLYPPNLQVGKATALVAKLAANQYSAKDTEIFEKWSQALASANDLVQSSISDNAADPAPVQTIILPILVVSDDTLWVADYTENGNVLRAPRQVETTEFYVNARYQIGQGDTYYAISHMHIFTKKGITEFMNQLNPSFETELRDWYKGQDGIN